MDVLACILHDKHQFVVKICDYYGGPSHIVHRDMMVKLQPCFEIDLKQLPHEKKRLVSQSNTVCNSA